jgi:uncharacterized protein (TIGR00645 family)
MRKLLQQSRYLVLFAVVFPLIASIAAFAWGGYQTIQAVIRLLTDYNTSSSIILDSIKLMDTFLVALALLIFSVAVYELFIGDLDMPEWLVVRNFQGLKAKLSSVVVLVMAITFLEHLVRWDDALETLFFGLAVSVVSAALLAFSQFAKDE